MEKNEVVETRQQKIRSLFKKGDIEVISKIVEGVVIGVDDDVGDSTRKVDKKDFENSCKREKTNT